MSTLRVDEVSQLFRSTSRGGVRQAWALARQQRAVTGRQT